ncbi:MAG: 1-acyl-sn-glycerol-3-phosphate acyltransferase [Desulfovibrionaceae bacterium]|nr:1-acyl-sn-glycerol-3-phosphate acyltransferase [Desulfovibrionaceae bacterium]
MLRVLLFYSLLFPVTLYYAASTVLFGKRASEKRREDLAGRVWGRRLVRILGLDLDVDLSAIEPGGHYVFVVNHQSQLDIPILFHVLWDHGVRFVAKKDLFDIPVFGPAMAAARHIPIDRENRRSAMKSVEAAVELAKSGVSPVIFPEGGRNPDPSKLMDFKIGGMVLALKCGLPVAPLVMAGTGELLPKGRLLIRRGKVRIRALPPVDPAAYTLKDRERFKDDLWQTMSTAYEKLVAENAHG